VWLGGVNGGAEVETSAVGASIKAPRGLGVGAPSTTEEGAVPLPRNFFDP